MSDVKWIKIVTDIFDDEKILLIEAMPEADSIITIWFKLLCLAGKQNNSGVFMLNDRIPYTDEMFATIFRRKLATVRLALTTFENLGMVEIVNGAVTIPNWGKHQSLERLEAEREYQRNYHREYRARQKLLASGEEADRKGLRTALRTDVHKANVKPTDIDIEKDIDREEDKEVEGDKNKVTVRKRTTPTRFTPPSVDEVQEFCNEKGYRIDAQHFIDYYEANGWKVGRNPMKDWKAAVRMWASRDNANGGVNNGNGSGTSEDAQKRWGNLSGIRVI